MKFTVVTIIIALACVLMASMAFAQTPKTNVQQAKSAHQQKVNGYITHSQRDLLRQKTPIVLKAMAVKHNKRGFAKVAHSAKQAQYSKSYATKGASKQIKQPKKPTQEQGCKNGVCPISHDPAAKQ